MWCPNFVLNEIGIECKWSVLAKRYLIFSNSLIVIQVKTKKITTVKEVWIPGLKLKGHSQLAHMLIRYHSIADLHITESRSILFLTKYDKKTLWDEQKHNQKQVSQ